MYNRLQIIKLNKANGFLNKSIPFLDEIERKSILSIIENNKSISVNYSSEMSTRRISKIISMNCSRSSKIQSKWNI